MLPINGELMHGHGSIRAHGLIDAGTHVLCMICVLALSWQRIGCLSTANFSNSSRNVLDVCFELRYCLDLQFSCMTYGMQQLPS